MSSPDAPRRDPLSSVPQVGDRVDRYVLVRKLGAGGMGAVFLAQDREAGLERALKLLPDRSDPELLKRFEREGRAMARVPRHPNVIQVMHGGEAGGCRFLVMELAGGGDLEGRLRGPLDPSQAARWTRDLADGLAHVHAHGVLHRDLKPGNVVFSADGRPQLTDFGLAAVADTRSLTESGTILGTPAYMAPEQALCEELDARTDVYGLGAILYRMLTHEAPYRGGSTLVLLSRVAEGSCPGPRARVPEVPEPLDAICRRAMAKAPSQRYPDAAALRDDLTRWLEGEEPLASAPSPAPRRRLALALAAVGLAIAVGVGLGVATRGTDPLSDPTPPPTPTVAAKRPAPSPTATPRLDLEEARTKLRLGRPKAAAQLLREQLETSPSAAGWLLLSEIALDLERLEEANGAARAAMRLAPDRAAPCLLLARCRLRQSQVADARVWVEAARRAEPEHPELGAVSWLFDLVLHPSPAVRDAGARWVQRLPGRYWLHLGLGVLEGELRRWKAAERQVTRAVELRPYSLRALLTRATLRQVQQNLRGALRDVRRVLAQRPRFLEALRCEIGVRLHSGDGDGTLQVASELEAAGGSQQQVAFARGAAHVAAKRYAEAIPYLRASARLEPHHRETRLELSAALAGTGAAAEAEQLLAELQVDPGTLLARVRVALLRKRYLAAKPLFEEYKRLARVPGIRGATLMYELALGLGDHASAWEAVGWMRRYRPLQPGRPEVMAMVLHGLEGDWDRAEATRAKFDRLNPHDPQERALVAEQLRELRARLGAR